MKSQKLVGTRICLKPLMRSNITGRVLKWLQDDEVTRYIESAPPKSVSDLVKFYDRIIKSENDKIFAIYLKRPALYIGNIKLGNINWRHKYADLGILIGEKDYWGKGYCQESARLLLKYAFDLLRLHKIFLGVCEDNRAAVKAYSNIGFKIEGRIKELLNYEGRYLDKIIMGISCKEFKEAGRNDD